MLHVLQSDFSVCVQYVSIYILCVYILSMYTWGAGKSCASSSPAYRSASSSSSNNTTYGNRARIGGWVGGKGGGSEG